MHRSKITETPIAYMAKNRIVLFLLAAILIEGYILLSVEILAIRLSIPFVGSGTDTISIIIAGVLLPLAAGYHKGGLFKPAPGRPPRARLSHNLFIALLFLCPGLSYIVLDSIFTAVQKSGFYDRRLLTVLFVSLFVAPPVYLLGQTIPLLSHYFRRKDLSRTTSNILFVSTLGSFMGATVPVLVFMHYMGLHYAAIFSLILLCILYMALEKSGRRGRRFAALGVTAATALLNSGPAMRAGGIVGNNAYNTVIVRENGDERTLFLNNSPSSYYTDGGRKFKNIELIERFALGPIWNAKTPHDILVIGAGGFTIGHEDLTNRYDFVDIDEELKAIAEQNILKGKIPPNHTFHVADARSFLNATGKKYDVIILDAYTGLMTMPEHLLTVEFFTQIRDHLKDKGVMAANLVMTPDFSSPFSRNLDATLRQVFPNALTNVMGDRYDLWNDDPNHMTNVLYYYKHRPDMPPVQIYSDLKSSAFADRPNKR